MMKAKSGSMMTSALMGFDKTRKKSRTISEVTRISRVNFATFYPR